MCGFVGFFTNKKIDFDKTIKKMNNTIVHRGPDSEGYFVDNNIALGFRRLSIIDLAGGDQPITSSDGRYTIVFNGEIYNYKDLRKVLKDKHNCLFSTNSDTETILQVYRYYKEKTASMLRGMFAFVIFDKCENSLYGARDYFGIKPFYYTNMNDNFIFGSEIKSFLEHPDFEKEVNKKALKLYLTFQYVPTKETIFKNVFKLTPGNYFVYKNNKMDIVSYFDANFEPEDKEFETAVKEIDDTVEQSVKYHKISDVEVGSFLSGGVDSSYIASLARPDNTYSVGFKIEGFDETTLAEDLCKILKINNKKYEIEPDEFFDALPSVQYFSDEPHANLSAVPLFFLSKLAAKDLKVVLSGEGADEFFAGYDFYIEGRVSQTYNKLPLGLRKAAAKILAHCPAKRLALFAKENAQTVEESYIGQAFIMDNEQANSLLNDKYKSDFKYQDLTKEYFDNVKDKDVLTKKMFLDLKLWLPNDILLKADKMTMAHSLELRVPFLDKEVWNVAKKLNNDQKVKDIHTKRAFRKAALSRLPKDWANRQKAGFMVPFRVWIREEKYASKVRQYFNTDFAKEFFNTDKLNTLLEKHLSKEENNARVIYTIYSFLLWYEQYFIIR